MSTDDFLDGLRGDWQSRSVDLGEAAQLVAQGEKRIRRERRGRVTQILLLGGLCIFFFWRAWVMQDILIHLGGVAFLTATALAFGDYFYLRRNRVEAYLDDPASVLARAEQQAIIARRLAEGLLAHSVLLSVCALIVIALVMVFAAYPPQVLLIALIWIAAAVGVFLVYLARHSQARKELEWIRAKRAELEGEG